MIQAQYSDFLLAADGYYCIILVRDSMVGTPYGKVGKCSLGRCECANIQSNETSQGLKPSNNLPLSYSIPTFASIKDKTTQST